MNEKNSYVYVKNVLIQILILNLLVAISKIIYGLLTNTASMSADGYHSLSDATSNIIGLIAIYVSSKPADKNHPYGHQKFETLATILISTSLFFIAYEILMSAYKRFIYPIHPKVDIFSFIIMIITLIINFFISRYEFKKGIELKSNILTSDSMHTKSDIYVSISVLISLIAIKLNFIIIDTIVAGIISILIIKAGFEILIPCINVLCDGAMIDSDSIYNFVMSFPQVIYCHKIRTHGKETHIMVDLHIGVPNSFTLEESHNLSHCIENMIVKQFEGVKEVIVHVEPVKKTK